MEVGTECLQLLGKVGFMACLEESLPKEAEKIFSAAVLARPEQPTPYIGLALANMGIGKFSDAVELLKDKALKIDPEHDRAKVLLSMALKMDGRDSESQALLEECMKSDDDRAKDLAAKLFEQK